MGYENYLQLYIGLKKRMPRNNELSLHLTVLSLTVDYLHLFLIVRPNQKSVKAS